MQARASSIGVNLPVGHTGSSLFHAVLRAAAEQFPEALQASQLPESADAFKREYGHALARFEACRAASAQRVEIARFVFQRTQALLQYVARDGAVPLTEYMEQRASRPPLEVQTSGTAGGLPVEVPFEGRLISGAQVYALVERLFEARQMTRAARDALRWIVARGLEQGGRLHLRGERFVVLGAAAELAPTQLLLRAGASVLWVDLADPTRALRHVGPFAGELVCAPLARNLLEQPREIAAAIGSFAAEKPVHVGMFAYAPGASQEWRLGVAMNAIVASLEPELVRSVSMLISPTTPSLLSEESCLVSARRLDELPAWQRALAALGVISRPGHVRVGDAFVSRSTVSLQGLSYQAAQYISKVAAAETFGVYGTASEGTRPVTVSANVAGVTRTRSLAHPLFEAAFAGAHRFGVRIFEPATTRALNTLLMLHDLLNPDAPGAAAHHGQTIRDKAKDLLAQQIDGGIHTLPFELDGVIRAAAVLGLAARPSVLLGKRGRAAARLEDTIAAE